MSRVGQQNMGTLMQRRPIRGARRRFDAGQDEDTMTHFAWTFGIYDCTSDLRICAFLHPSTIPVHSIRLPMMPALLRIKPEYRSKNMTSPAVGPVLAGFAIRDATPCLTSGGLLVWQVAQASGVCHACTDRALLRRGVLAALRRACCTPCALSSHAVSLATTGASDPMRCSTTARLSATMPMSDTCAIFL